MILERANFTIKPGHAREFEEAFRQARAYIARAKGFIRCEMRACIERENDYVLLVEWETLDDHMRGFRESADFQEWRALMGPHFAGAPDVIHYEAPLAV